MPVTAKKNLPPLGFKSRLLANFNSYHGFHHIIGANLILFVTTNFSDRKRISFENQKEEEKKS